MENLDATVVTHPTYLKVKGAIQLKKVVRPRKYRGT